MSTPAPSEFTYYTDELGVRVTNTRLIVGSTTYAMSNITSVSRSVKEPSNAGPVFLAVVGFIFLIIGLVSGFDVGRLTGWSTGMGAVVLGIGILWAKRKAFYGLRIFSSSGESTPIRSHEKVRIDRIVQAVNEAIIAHCQGLIYCPR